MTEQFSITENLTSEVLEVLAKLSPAIPPSKKLEFIEKELDLISAEITPSNELSLIKAPCSFVARL
jgi:hypothetical protein